jgi:hypothetical protein
MAGKMAECGPFARACQWLKLAGAAQRRLSDRSRGEDLD